MMTIKQRDRPKSSVTILLETVKKYLRIERKEIAYLRFIFEAYDGLAVLRTIDAEAGIVVLHIAPNCETEVDAVLLDLQKAMMIEAFWPHEAVAPGASPGLSRTLSDVNQRLSENAF